MGMQAEQQLFCNETFFEFERIKQHDIAADIELISDDDLLLPDSKEMLDYLVAKYSLEELYLDKDSIEKIPQNGKKEFVDNFGRWISTDILTIFWKIPFSGQDGLLLIQPSRCSMQAFEAAIDNNYLIISDYAPIADIQNTPNIIENKLKTKLDNFSTQIANLNSNIQSFNSSLRAFISRLMDSRRNKADIIKRALEVMNIPLKKNKEAPSIIPLKRKLVKPSMPTVKREMSYEILDDDYNHILGVIRHVGATFERARKTFCKLDEEELRDVILANLNGHYLGLATGETFRNNGKTDINIEFENRAAFVGECKIWKGDKIFQETIDQLVGYTTWRDDKNAMIFFNKKNKGFKAIQEKLCELISKLDGCTKIDTKAGEWEFKLTSTDYEKTIHVFLFDIYEENKDTESEK